jgi:hypothetical protein
VPIHIGCGYCLLHSLRMLPLQSTIHSTKSRINLWLCVEAIDRTGGEDGCPLAIVLVQVVLETNTAILMQ